MPRMIFVNFPVRDLEKSKAFFAALGFEIDPQLSNESAACVVIEAGSIQVMLIAHDTFAGFAPKAVCDAREQNEVGLCLSCVSREEVDALVRKALAAGGTTYEEPKDYGSSYGHGFQDLDGHVWDLMWMDPAAASPQA